MSCTSINNFIFRNILRLIIDLTFKHFSNLFYNIACCYSLLLGFAILRGILHFVVGHLLLNSYRYRIMIITNTHIFDREL